MIKGVVYQVQMWKLRLGLGKWLGELGEWI